MLICCREEVKHLKLFNSKQILIFIFIISLVCPVMVVLSIHPSRHPSCHPSIHPSSSSRKKKMMEEEEDDEWQQFIQMFM
jgi:cell division protein FtsL